MKQLFTPLLAHLSHQLGSQCELTVNLYSGVRPSSSTIFKALQNRFASKHLRRSLHGRGERKFVEWSRSHDQDGCHAHIW